MKSEMLAHSPLLALPLVALFMFLAIFLGIFVMTMKKKALAYEPIARLPLEGEDDGDAR